VKAKAGFRADGRDIWMRRWRVAQHATFFENSSGGRGVHLGSRRKRLSEPVTAGRKVLASPRERTCSSVSARRRVFDEIGLCAMLGEERDERDCFAGGARGELLRVGIGLLARAVASPCAFGRTCAR